MSRPRIVTVALVAALGVAGLASPGGAAPPTGLPDAAAPQGHAHAHTHGPDGLDLDRGRRPGASVVAEPVDVQLTAPWSSAATLPVVTRDQPDRLPGMPSVHLVYLHPADVKPRTSFLPMFEADARAAQSFLQATTGRSVRFDEVVLGSTPRLDITTVKSRYKASQLGGGSQFGLVKDDLTRAFPDGATRKKYVAWLDAPSTSCGQGELYRDERRSSDNFNDLRTTAVVYRPYPSTGADGGFCRGRTLLHELGHNFGALQAVAPNSFDDAHCSDDRNDVMCYTSASTQTSDGAGRFDFGNDDYWDAGAQPGRRNSDATGHLGWWTANLSRFVCRPAAEDQLRADCGDASTVLPTAAELTAPPT